MSSSEKPDKDQKAEHADKRAHEADDAPAWAQGLKQLYDSVVEEPLPDTFKDLLDAFDESTGPGDNAGTGKQS